MPLHGVQARGPPGSGKIISSRDTKAHIVTRHDCVQGPARLSHALGSGSVTAAPDDLVQSHSMTAPDTAHDGSKLVSRTAPGQHHHRWCGNGSHLDLVLVCVLEPGGKRTQQVL